MREIALNLEHWTGPVLLKSCLFIQNGSQASRSGEEGAGCGLRPQPAPSSPFERRRREQPEHAPTFEKPCGLGKLSWTKPLLLWHTFWRSC